MIKDRHGVQAAKVLIDAFYDDDEPVDVPNADG